jgi:uncharacterized membrane protein
VSTEVRPEVPRDIREHEQPAPTRWRYLLYVIGAVMVFIGLKGIIHNDRLYENPIYWAKLFVGPAVAHDVIFVPLVSAGGYLLSRLVSPRYRPPIQLGLFASFVLTLVAWPGLRQYSMVKDNTSANPLNYAHGLIICLGVVWAVVAGSLVWRYLSARRSAP